MGICRGTRVVRGRTVPSGKLTPVDSDDESGNMKYAPPAKASPTIAFRQKFEPLPPGLVPPRLDPLLPEAGVLALLSLGAVP